MKRISVIMIVAVLALAASAAAQTSAVSPTSRPLADVVKDEEARRKALKKPAKVYTNGDLRAAPATGAAPATDAPAGAPGNATPAGGASSAAPDATAPADAGATPAKQDQAYWQDRIKAARDQVQRSQLFADSLQTRINSLWTDFVNRDNPVEKAKLEQDRNTALAELEKLKKEITAQQKAITAIEDEARRAGVPAGWLRPGA